jgi:hypothetical protein
MHSRLPPVAVALGIAGLIPFVGCGIEAVSRTDLQSASALLALIGYGAVILAFLGGVHWGFVLAPDAAPAGLAPALAPAAKPWRGDLRLMLGVVPSLIGWAGLLAAELVAPDVGLALLIVGFIATVVTEWHIRHRAAIPPGYMWMRWGLTLVVLLTLITVLALRLLGARIIL